MITPTNLHYTQMMKVQRNLKDLRVPEEDKKAFNEQVLDAALMQNLKQSHIDLLNQLSHAVESQLGKAQCGKH